MIQVYLPSCVNIAYIVQYHEWCTTDRLSTFTFSLQPNHVYGCACGDNRGSSFLSNNCRCDKYVVEVSERLGRTNNKEQYAFVYRYIHINESKWPLYNVCLYICCTMTLSGYCTMYVYICCTMTLSGHLTMFVYVCCTMSLSGRLTKYVYIIMLYNDSEWPWYTIALAHLSCSELALGLFHAQSVPLL